MKAFSIDFVGEFALFKKNDVNDMVHISYNFIHKPVVLGMLGAILGLSGYAKSGPGKMPEYYEILKDIKIAIMPFYEKPLKKAITGFNNASGMGSDAGTWMIREQVLVGEPEIRYRIFIEATEKTKELQRILSNYETEYPLYFGKNEFFAYYEQYQEYEGIILGAGDHYIQSLFKKGEDDSVADLKKISFGSVDFFSTKPNTGYTIYEHLPYDFDEHGFYLKDIFMLTQNQVEVKVQEGFFKLKNKQNEEFNVQFI